MIRHRGEALPGFRRGPEVVLAALGGLRPPRGDTVAEVAEARRVLRNRGGGYSGPWRNAMAPMLVEPMEALTRRDVLELCILGPAQFGKTEILLNAAVYQAAEGGADFLIVQPSESLARDFGERRLAAAFNATPELAALIGEGRGDDKLLVKVGRNGARISLAWPVGTQLASRPVPWVALDELDSMPEQIGEEGDPVTLARQRTTTFGSLAKIITMSTPKRADGGGIAGRWRLGDQRLWHWPCPDCGEFWTPGFDEQRRPSLCHLRVTPGASEAEARAGAALICPHCGVVLEERHKAAMNARGLWLPAGATITAAGEVGGDPLRSAIRSYWFSGLAQRNRSWADLAAQYVAALRDVEDRQDETALRGFWNASLGAPYRSVIAAAAALEPEELKARAEALPLGVVPAWAGFVTVAGDVQGNRFDLQAVAWGPEGRAQIIEAWQLFKARDAETGEERMLDPARQAEDWQLLERDALGRRWPGEAGGEFRAELLAVDTGGADGVTGQAYAWWGGLRQRDPGQARRVLLVKGHANRDAPLLGLRRIEQDGRGRKLRRGINLCLVNTPALKDQADIRLRMKRMGPGFLHLPRELPARVWDELTAEVKVAGRWEKQRGRIRNESFDLLVYNLAAWHRRGGPRLDWRHPAEWHRPRLSGATVAGGVTPEAIALAVVPEVPAPPPVAPVAPAEVRPAVPGRSRFWKPAGGRPAFRAAARF